MTKESTPRHTPSRPCGEPNQNQTRLEAPSSAPGERTRPPLNTPFTPTSVYLSREDGVREVTLLDTLETPRGPAAGASQASARPSQRTTGINRDNLDSTSRLRHAPLQPVSTHSDTLASPDRCQSRCVVHNSPFSPAPNTSLCSQKHLHVASSSLHPFVATLISVCVLHPDRHIVTMSDQRE